MCDLRCDRHRHIGSVISVINIQHVWWSSRGRGRPEVTEICSAGQTYIFVPIAMETFGPLNMAGFQFLNELGRRISQESDDSRECEFLFQRLSMTIQRFNAVAIQGTFAMRTPTEDEISDILPFQQICSH